MFHVKHLIFSVLRCRRWTLPPATGKSLQGKKGIRFLFHVKQEPDQCGHFPHTLQNNSLAESLSTPGRAPAKTHSQTLIVTKNLDPR